MRRVAVMFFGAVVIFGVSLAFAYFAQPTSPPQTSSHTQEPVKQPAPNDIQALTERVSKVEFQLATLSGIVAQLTKQVGDVDLVKLAGVVMEQSKTLTNLSRLSDTSQESLGAHLQAMQQSIDELNQKIEEDRQQLEATHKELIGARESAQLGILIGLAGVIAALLLSAR